MMFLSFYNLGIGRAGTYILKEDTAEEQKY